MRKKIYLTENQFVKLFNINEGFGKKKVNTQPQTLKDERPQFAGSKGKTYGDIWDDREKNSKTSIFYPNQKDCELFLSAKTKFQNIKNEENFKKYVNAGKALLNGWMGIINSSIYKFNKGRTSGFFEPSEEKGKYDDFCGIVCRFACLPDIFEMSYFYDSFANEKKCIQELMKLGITFMHNNPKFKVLLPTAWTQFSPILKNINSKGQPQYIPTQEEIENLPNEDEMVDNIEDLEFDFNL